MKMFQETKGQLVFETVNFALYFKVIITLIINFNFELTYLSIATPS